jgi:HSP90 family molecular chaperone
MTFSKERKSRIDKNEFRSEWETLNRENRLWSNTKNFGKEKYDHFFTHMCTECRLLIRRVTKFGDVIKDAKLKNEEKWYCKYQKVARSFFNEDFEQVNCEAR